MRTRLAALLAAPSLVLATTVATVATSSPPAQAAAVRIEVPTSAAGLGRIVASPDGSVWFVEKDAQKVGRIVGGQVSEFSFYTDDYAQVEDLDVAPDGTVWVIWDSGRYASHLRPDFSEITRVTLSGYPEGDEIRVAPDGRAYVTLGYDTSSIAVLGDTQGSSYKLPNAPACDATLGLGAGGSIWCQSGNSSLTNVNPSGGGSTYPAGNYAAWPYAIAPGPVGSVWFGRYEAGSFAFSPSDGEIGYLDAATSAVKAYPLGDRVAPGDIVQGPDGNMWFTSIGAAKGIGHIAPNGSGGVLTQIGTYEPESLTFGTDGALYAADAQNNVIIKLSRSDVQTTNVDPGSGSVLGAGGSAAAKKKAGTLKVGKAPLPVRNGRVGVKVACPKTVSGSCTATAQLRGATKKHRALSAPARYRIKHGKTKVVQIKLSKAGLRALPAHRVSKVRIDVRVKGVKKPVVTKTVKVRRP